MKVESLLGPSLLFTTLALLVYKTAPVLGRPFWIVGIALSMAIAALICYWGYQEIRSRFQKLSEYCAQQGEKNETLRSMLDETRKIHKEKVAQLENGIEAIEKEGAQMQKSYTLLYDQSAEAKLFANAYKCSLEDALDELRALRQEVYLDQQWMGKVPKDLPQQHEQLRAQFEEKSAVLDQTRRRLFQHEGYVALLQKTQEMQRQELSWEQDLLIKEIDLLLEENEGLEMEIVALEELITPPAKKAPAKKQGKKALEKMLEFQFEEVH